jgi:hypothetical protein
LLFIVFREGEKKTGREERENWKRGERERREKRGEEWRNREFLTIDKFEKSPKAKERLPQIMPY